MSKTEHEYLKGIDPKYFTGEFLADQCKYCDSRMIYPAMGTYICPNEKCQYSYICHPERSGDSSIEVTHKTNFEAFK